MKRCPTCSREYTDDGLSFCLDDGAKLNPVSAAPEDPQATLMISPENLRTLQQQPRDTDPNRGQDQQPFNPPPPPRSQQTQAAGSWGAIPPSAPSAPSYTPPSAARPAPKRSALPWVIGGVVILVVGAVGVIFLVIVFAAISSNNNNNNNNRGIVVNKNNNEDSPTPTPTPSTKVINSKDGVSQISVPDEWEEATGLNNSATIQASNPADSVYCIVITDSKTDLASSNTLQSYGHDRSRKLTETLTEMTETGPDTITVNGESGVLYEIHGEISNLKAAYLFAVVETSGHYHQIGTWTTESKFPDRRATMMAIIQSFREK